MRHLRAHRKLGRTHSHRRALLRNLVSSLFVAEAGSIRTTLEKAKEARRMAEKMITLGKREGVHARRVAGRFIADRGVLHRLFEVIAPRYGERKGGYTRVLRLGPRPGDNAEMAILELVDIAEELRKARTAGGDKARAKDKKPVGEGEADKAARPARESAPRKERSGGRLGRGAEKSKAGAQTKSQTKGGKRGA